jgi:hypothetical protein
VTINNTAGVEMNVNVLIGGLISPVTGSLYFNGYTLTMGGQVSLAYTNPAAFSVTPSSNLNITGNAALGNRLYFNPAADTLHNHIIFPGASGVLGNALYITSGKQVFLH